jgi:hypothetical protein
VLCVSWKMHLSLFGYACGEVLVLSLSKCRFAIEGKGPDSPHRVTETRHSQSHSGRHH